MGRDAEMVGRATEELARQGRINRTGYRSTAEMLVDFATEIAAEAVARDRASRPPETAPDRREALAERLFVAMAASVGNGVGHKWRLDLAFAYADAFLAEAARRAETEGRVDE